MVAPLPARNYFNHWGWRLIQRGICILLNARVAVSAKQGDASGATAGFVEAEKRYRDLYGDADARSWLAMLPRTQWLASRGQRDDQRQSHALAKQIWVNVRERLSPNAPVIAQLNALQQ